MEHQVIGGKLLDAAVKAARATRWWRRGANTNRWEALQELRKATGWQADWVQKMGSHIDPVSRDDGELAYRVASK